MIVTSGAAAGTYFYHQDALGSVVALSKFGNFDYGVTGTALGLSQRVLH